jgi:hypothetical protein
MPRLKAVALYVTKKSYQDVRQAIIQEIGVNPPLHNYE